ncbi:MAG: uracil-DNA glycosylase [Planctomycetes bacterium]|nr:uracil-DNA glycosylase [Planctomycetota bacterium]
MTWELPASWASVLAVETQQPYFARLRDFVDRERQRYPVYPPAEDMFRAFALTPYHKLRIVLLGQDPYHDEGQANGLCFSVRSGVRPPPSLMNIFRELSDDVGCPIPEHGCLTAWARRGVLLLNSVLTVRAHKAHSHRGAGWEQFTDAVIQKISDRRRPVAFVLWGRPAQEKAGLIDTRTHAVIQSPHPSPLSARRGFFGSRPFSAVNQALAERGVPAIDWRLPSREPTSRHRPEC